MSRLQHFWGYICVVTWTLWFHTHIAWLTSVTMATQSPQDMYWSMAPVTRGYMTLVVLTTIAVEFGLVNPASLLLNWKLIFYRFEIWRVVTCFIFFGGFGLGFLFQVYFLVKYSGMMEADPFPSGGGSHQGTTADYFFMLVVGALVMFLVTIFFPMPVLGSCMVFMIIYTWSRRNPQQPMSFFGFKFAGIYTPWVLVAFHVLVGHSPVPDLIGIAAGHVYYFVQEVLPVADTPLKGRRLLHTPTFLINFFDAPVAAPGRGPNNPAGYQWGQGQALG